MRMMEFTVYSSSPSLLLVIEEAAYSLSSIICRRARSRWCIQLGGGEEELSVYSSSSPRHIVYRALLTLEMGESAHSRDRGQRVQHLLHCKTEDKE